MRPKVCATWKRPRGVFQKLELNLLDLFGATKSLECPMIRSCGAAKEETGKEEKYPSGETDPTKSPEHPLQNLEDLQTW